MMTLSDALTIANAHRPAYVPGEPAVSERPAMRGLPSLALMTILEQRIDDLISHPDMDPENETLKADMLEGETNLDVIMGQIVQERILARADYNAAQEAKRAMIERMDARAERARKREETCNAMIGDIFDHAKIQSYKTGAGTVSRRSVEWSLQLDEGFEPPQGYARVKVEPDKAAIKAALDNGERMPGARLVRGKPFIVVR
jgi:ribosomal protein L12E/L44/L45/RPP1/RPP2